MPVRVGGAHQPQSLKGRHDAVREAELWRAQLGGSHSRREIFRSRKDAEAWLASEAS